MIEVRTITKPVAGTVKVYVDGIEQLSGWSVDTTTGLVTFGTPPALGVEIVDHDLAEALALAIVHGRALDLVRGDQAIRLVSGDRAGSGRAWEGTRAHVSVALPLRRSTHSESRRYNFVNGLLRDSVPRAELLQ